ncbi:MAG: hypothetical protein H7287_11855, partial [Thermoleophilia bacterium]|nr:hypothetical protein [Thermoleophilia bacterium]
MKWLRSNLLSIFFLVILLGGLAGEALAGVRVFNAAQLEHGGTAISTWGYVQGPVFWGHVMENWQSEFLQFSLFIGATIWLVQRGSSESKSLEDAGLERARDHGRSWLYANSLLIVMTSIFFATWTAQSLANRQEFNDDQHAHGGAALSWLSYVRGADFWERSLQNWQSEFLAVGAMIVFSIYLRQQGSPESKRVGTP